MNADNNRQVRPRASTPASASILPVEPRDVEFIAGLAREIWRRHYADIISAAQIEYMLNQRYEPRMIRAELRCHDLWWDKLLVGEVIIGFASYFLTEQPGEMKLDKLYVHQDFQRKGYGGMLIAHACARARVRGCARLMLAVNKNNRIAISAYRKHGFRVSTGVVKDIGGGFVMDDYIMVKALESTNMFKNPDEQQRCALLKSVKNIAVVGLSPNPTRPSHGVARAMLGFGFNIVPVHPTAKEVLGKKAYPRLADVPVPIDLVDVFRRAEFVDAVVDECLDCGLKALWIQEGIVNVPAAVRAREAGMIVVMDRCIYHDFKLYCA